MKFKFSLMNEDARTSIQKEKKEMMTKSEKLIDRK